MSDVKLLNLDDIADIKRVVQIKGVDYEVADQTVGQMATRLKLSKKLKMDKPEDFIEMMRQTAKNILPSASDEVIDGLTADQIHKLVEFINDRDLEESAERLAEEAKRAEDAKGGNKAKESGEPEKKS